MFYIHRKGEQLGPYNDSTIASFLKNGTLDYTDFIWQEGWTDWKTVEAVFPRLTQNVPPPSIKAAISPQTNPPPEASFGQVWRRAWGQALQEHQNKHGITSFSTPATVQVISSPRANHRSVSLASWILLFISCLGSMVPGLGFAVWVIILPVLLVTFILGIIAITRGGVFQGILILAATLIFVPLFVLLAPIATTAAAGGYIQSQNTQR